MALDWIKIEHALPGKPEVMELARILELDEMAVVGHLVCFWSWVDQNLSPECPSASGTKRGLDRVSGKDGFVDAMVSVGWLEFDGHTVTIPNYDHHLSESAKKRGVEARKKQRQRRRPQECTDDKGTNTGQSEGPEKRREELASLSANTGLDEVRIPDKLNTPECQQAAELWFSYLEANALQHKSPKDNGLNLQTWWNQMARHSAEDFCLAVPDSIARRRWDVTFDKIGGSDGHKKRNGHSKYSKDLMKVVKVCKEHQGGDKWQIREQHMGPELTKAMKASGGSGEVLAASADDFKLQTFSEIFEMHLADIRKGNHE